MSEVQLLQFSHGVNLETTVFRYQTMLKVLLCCLDTFDFLRSRGYLSFNGGGVWLRWFLLADEMCTTSSSFLFRTEWDLLVLKSLDIAVFSDFVMTGFRTTGETFVFFF